MEDAATPSPPAGASPGGANELDQVRELLFGRERTELSEIKERLENPELHARDVGRVLADAVRLSSGEGEALAKSLARPVEAALHESVRRRPGILTNAIFPIIGPAIRRATSEAFARMVQSVNQALEHSFSPRGLKWRWEAMRTGRTYAEIVLSRTLVYRVEQVFLIQRSTGLLLHQVTRADVTVEKGEVVSGLLTAIQDFAAESFRVGPGESLDRFQVGALSVWVETGPHASLAAVIRGQPPLGLRETLQQALEQIHRESGDRLGAASGVEDLAGGTDAALAECLRGEYEGGGGGGGVPWKVWVLVALVVVGLGYWLVQGFRENERWSRYLERLAREPGLLIVRDGTSGGRYRVTGWRDPLAPNPADLLRQFGFGTNDVVARWEPYESASPGLIVRRAALRLRPPAGVELKFEDGVLRAEGVASKEWVEGARRRAEAMAWVERFDGSRVFDEGRARLAAGLKAVEGAVLYFEETTRLVAGQDEVVARLAAGIKGVHEGAAKSGQSAQFVVGGHADRKGTEDYNLRLSRLRAEEAKRLLEAQGVPGGWLVTEGYGTQRPVRADLPAAEEYRNRRVTLRVVLDPAGTGTGTGTATP